MAETKVQSTYQLASQQIAEYVQPIAPGALAFPFEAYDELGRMLKLEEDYLSGKFLILVFLNSYDQQTNLATLKAIAAKQPLLDKLNTAVIAVSASSDASKNILLKQQASFIWPIIGDAGGSIFAAYGMHKLHGQNIRLVLLTPLRQIRTWSDSPETIENSLEVMTTMIQNHPCADDNRWSTPFAPVLQIPNVLSPQECAKIIESFETDCPFFVRPPHPNEVSGSFKVPVYEHNRQDRVDAIVKDKALIEFIDSRIWARVIPMIHKAFAFTANRREHLHIARYVGERGGVQMGHRDNTAPQSAYRRFALSLNLNDNYQGGEVSFKEFSQQGYKSPAGSALVFSSSLLHEVSEITQGTRYTLISNFFNDGTAGKS